MKEKLKILIVDDEYDILKLWQSFFSSFDDFFIEAHFASGGVEAHEKCAETNDYILIISDFKMPEMNGLDFIRYIREKMSNYKTTPVLFFSGYLDVFKQEAELLDNVYLLEKPMKFKKVGNMISMLILAEVKKMESNTDEN